MSGIGGDKADRSSPQALRGPPLVIYAQIKYMWAKGFTDESLAYLRDFTERLREDLESQRAAGGIDPEQADQIAEYTRLLSRCYFKLAEWQTSLSDDWSTVTDSRPVGCD